MKNKADYPFIFKQLEDLYKQSGEIETPFDYTLTPFDYFESIDDEVKQQDLPREAMASCYALADKAKSHEKQDILNIIDNTHSFLLLKELDNYSERKVKADAIFDVLNDKNLSLSDVNLKVLAIQNGAPLDILALGVISQSYKSKGLSTEFKSKIAALRADIRARSEMQAAVESAATNAISEHCKRITEERLKNDKKQKALTEIKQHYEANKSQFSRRGWCAIP